ncbi:hypothetical protein [Noviherbaspirillum saxi]|uniref:hypothetical protein n=1 Tax=Noviherbaspirillum saxi TaxID=2320863 RepID=UPI0011C40BE4|nr:hypothetical protein [Noviherbaspirillum saxi]
MNTEFESVIAQLTQPINGQLPRPWMTDVSDPISANVFIVGKNQRNGFDSSRLSHTRHLDALFNRRGESCREVYDEMTNGNPSPTRLNTDRFRELLRSVGVSQVLETNVICYSTPMSAHLQHHEHRGGALRGTEIFTTLLRFVKPRILIAHGSGTCETLGKVLNRTLPPIPTALTTPSPVDVGEMTIFTIPSLAPPKWNAWKSWADEYLKNISKAVANAL